jgi:hypothetical protein
MGRNGMDDNAPASEGVRPVDERPGAARHEDPPEAVDAEKLPPPSDRRPALRVVPRCGVRIGRPTRLTPRLAKALVKLIAQTGRIEPAARRCGIPPSTVTDWIARGQGRHVTRGANRLYAEFAGAVEGARQVRVRPARGHPGGCGGKARELDRIRMAARTVGARPLRASEPSRRRRHGHPRGSAGAPRRSRGLAPALRPGATSRGRDCQPLCRRQGDRWSGADNGSMKIAPRDAMCGRRGSQLLRDPLDHTPPPSPALFDAPSRLLGRGGRAPIARLGAAQPRSP